MKIILKPKATTKKVIRIQLKKPTPTKKIEGKNKRYV